MNRCTILLSLLLLVVPAQAAFVNNSKCALLCGLLCPQCSTCDSNVCPPSEAYPHMTGFDNSLIVGALQSDLVPAQDRGVYAVPAGMGNTFFGWQFHSGSASGFHRFTNYMDKCSNGANFLTVDAQLKVSLRSLGSLTNLSEADWKSFVPPPSISHVGFRFWVSGSTGKCLTVFPGLIKRTVGVDTCKFDGSNGGQLFAFRFHYHKAFCCCGVQNN